MEGILFKWTNYYNGWQSRYFLLNDQGVLSYYKSKELIDQGCKGSCLVDACQLKVHPHDPLRFDLIIPGEQFFSLKAKNQCERQQWLLAIGALKSKGNLTIQQNEQKTNFNPINQELKMKIQELNLFQTVLTQGIHNLKSSVNDRPIVDLKDLDQSRLILGETCDAFIQTLDECVKLANGNSSLITKPRRYRFSSSSSSTSNEKKFANESQFRTFFSEIPSRFSQLDSFPLNQIPLDLFLRISEEYFSLFDKFPSPTFIPLKSEIQSNISKIRRKMSNDSKKFYCLTSIVDDEISTNSTKEKNSATDALLWLTRNLHFLQTFLFEFGQKTRSVEEAMNIAYGTTLKPFHGWITRGIFSIAFRSVPLNEDFLHSLSNETNSIDENQIYLEMIEQSEDMKKIIENIFEFYFEKKIFSKEIIE